MNSSGHIRLQKYMADCGVASRRNAEKMIAGGMVRVNGMVVRELGTKVDPENDRVTCPDVSFAKSGSRSSKIGHRDNQQPVTSKNKKIYIKLYKPPGYVSSCRKFGNEKTILDLVKDIPERLFPIGRLDKESEGLMILTNDGELANKLMHPRYEHEKEYEVTVMKPLGDREIRMLRDGMDVEGRKTLPTKVQQLDERVYRITLREGKKRQIRKMIQAVGSRVIKLKRIRIGGLTLDGLNVGKHLFLSSLEVRNLGA